MRGRPAGAGPGPDPAEICGLFVEYAGGAAPDDAERQVLRGAVETAEHAEAVG